MSDLKKCHFSTNFVISDGTRSFSLQFLTFFKLLTLIHINWHILTLIDTYCHLPLTRHPHELPPGPLGVVAWPPGGHAVPTVPAAGGRGQRTVASRHVVPRPRRSLRAHTAEPPANPRQSGERETSTILTFVNVNVTKNRNCSQFYGKSAQDDEFWRKKVDKRQYHFKKFSVNVKYFILYSILRKIFPK